MFGHRIPGDGIVADFATREQALADVIARWRAAGRACDSRVVQVGPVQDGNFQGGPEMVRCEISLEGLLVWKKLY